MEMMKWDSSFQEPWKDMMEIVMIDGLAIGSTIDQKIRNVPARSTMACSSTLRGIDSKKFFMMNTPPASTSNGKIMPA